MFKHDPTLTNFLGAAVDGAALAIPFLPGGVGAIRAATSAAEGAASAASHASDGSLVIGKLTDLASESGWRAGDHTLALPPKGTVKENWEQNASRLREAMRDGKPIRDVSVDANGLLRDNTGFLKAERSLLEDKGWAYNRETQSWHPPQ